MRSVVLCGGFVVFATLLGCSDSSPYSSSVYAVSGKVLLPSGEPVRGGAEILLTPKAKEGGIFGKEGSAIIGADGTFTIKSGETDGIPGGFYVVVVRPYGVGNSTDKTAAIRTIPKKYTSEDTSDMTVEIKEAKTGWEVKLAK